MKKTHKKRKTLILDINLIPKEYKEGTTTEIIKNYEKLFNVKVIPIDSSRTNTDGNDTSPFVQVLD